MLWKVLVPLCLLCLSGLASEEEDFDFIGKRKLLSVDTDNKTETEETVTENSQLENKTESGTENEEPVTEGEESVDEENESEEEEDEKADEKADEKNEDEGENGDEDENEEQEEEEEVKPKEQRKSDTASRRRPMFNSTIIPWHLESTYLHLYTRTQGVQTVRANQWFYNFDPNRHLVILVHGASTDPYYIRDYFNSLAYALLNESNYNVIGVDWKNHVVDTWKEDHVAANVHFARLLGIMLHTLFAKYVPGFFTNKIKTYYIGHDIATITPITFKERFRKPFHYVYGLDPRRELPHSGFRLAQEHGEVVAIMATFEYPYSYAHKNFRVLPRNGSLSYSYHVLAKNIFFGGNSGIFCPSTDHFLLGYCNMLPRVPVWFTHSYWTDRSYPTGKYYFYDLF